VKEKTDCFRKKRKKKPENLKQLVGGGGVSPKTKIQVLEQFEAPR
jgi:hypothetical protein